MDGRAEGWCGKAETCLLRGQTELEDGRFLWAVAQRSRRSRKEGKYASLGWGCQNIFSKRQLGCRFQHHKWSMITVENCVGGIRNFGVRGDLQIDHRHHCSLRRSSTLPLGMRWSQVGLGARVGGVQPELDSKSGRHTNGKCCCLGGMHM